MKEICCQGEKRLICTQNYCLRNENNRKNLRLFDIKYPNRLKPLNTHMFVESSTSASTIFHVQKIGPTNTTHSLVLGYFQVIWGGCAQFYVKFKFWCSHVKKFKFIGVEILVHIWTNWSISQKNFGDRLLIEFKFCSCVWLVAFEFLIFKNNFLLFW